MNPLELVGIITLLVLSLLMLNWIWSEILPERVKDLIGDICLYGIVAANCGAILGVMLTKKVLKVDESTPGGAIIGSISILVGYFIQYGTLIYILKSLGILG